jgi:CRP/FNR family transcriptional regulator
MDNHGPPSSLCDECAARHQGICGAVSPAQLERLKRTGRRQSVRAGESLVDPSAPPTHFSVILNGAVKLSKVLPDGRQQIVGLQYAPDFLGRPFLNESDVAVEAVTDTTLCNFSRRAVEEMIAETPDLEHRLYLQALAELDDAREMLLTLGRRTAREKVATFLLFILRQTGGRGDAARMQSHSLLLSRAEIGDFLGLAIETVSRQLNKLQAMGIVELEHNRAIRIVDVDRLKQEAGSAEPDSGVSGRDRPDPDRDEGRAQPSSRQRFAP